MTQSLENIEEVDFVVLVNEEEQYSLWRAKQDIPEGWRATGNPGSRQACLDHISQVWTDMRPKSLRQKMDA